MKIKQIGIVLLLLFISTQIIAQTVEGYVKEGITYHDKGDYDKAIEIYKKALKIDSKSALVNYEIALSYYSKGDYKQAVKYSDAVLKKNQEFMIQAYMTKGSALDMLGKTQESIKLFEKAIKKTGGHYLLHYNLALNYYKKGELDNAEEHVIKAIKKESNHSSSHLMLADIHDRKGNSVQALLAAHYFLFLEPNTQRSLQAYNILQSNFGGNVSKDKDNPNTINITLSANNDSQFGAAELMLSMLEASKTLEKNEGKTDDEMFVENTKSFFTMMGELKKDKNKGLWWTFYTPFFYDLAKTDHIEVYCNYISQSGNKNSEKWLTQNDVKINAFADWLKEY